MILDQRESMLDYFIEDQAASKAWEKHLNSNADGPVPHVRSLCRFHWVVVHVDNLVQISCDQLGDLSQLVKIEEPAAINLTTLRRTY